MRESCAESLQTSPCLTHLSRRGSLLCLTTAWTSLVVSPATGVSLTSSRSSSWKSLPLWQTAPPGRSSPITGNCPFSAPPFNSSPSSPSSFLQRTLSWTLFVQWFFFFFRVLDMARRKGKSHECGCGRSFVALGSASVSRQHCKVIGFSGKRQLYPCPRSHSRAQQLDHQPAFAITESCRTCAAFRGYFKNRNSHDRSLCKHHREQEKRSLGEFTLCE